jgi:hypothetical protein
MKISREKARRRHLYHEYATALMRGDFEPIYQAWCNMKGISWEMADEFEFRRNWIVTVWVPMKEAA